MVDDFISARRSRWERLESLLARIRGREARLAAEELVDLGRLYRQATSDLAIARRDFPRDRLTRYLEQLVGRAHPAVYRRQASDWRTVSRFFTHEFPRAFREAGAYTAIAFALFAFPFLFAMFATLFDPLVGRMIVPSRNFVEGVEAGQSWLEIDEARRAMAATSIMTNNIQVAFLAFSGGVLFGLGTVFVLIYNGIVIGSIAGLASAHGLGDALSAFVAAHGGVELTVIFIAGGAGLRLGHSLLVPGLLTRRAALAAAARRAVRLIYGCVPLLVVAGLLEGFVSPSALLPSVKAVVGVTATVVLFIYLLSAGRDPTHARGSQQEPF